MDQIKRALVDNSPLYPVLADVVTAYLEPCLDYDVLKCNHKVAFCVCGNTFEFRRPLYPAHARGKRVLVEKFCPHCGEPNPHKSPDDPKWLQRGWWMAQEKRKALKAWTSWNGGIRVKPPRGKKYLKCPRCETRADSYDHIYCTACQHKLEWAARPCFTNTPSCLHFSHLDAIKIFQ